MQYSKVLNTHQPLLQCSSSALYTTGMFCTISNIFLNMEFRISTPKTNTVISLFGLLCGHTLLLFCSRQTKQVFMCVWLWHLMSILKYYCLKKKKEYWIGKSNKWCIPRDSTVLLRSVLCYRQHLLYKKTCFTSLSSFALLSLEMHIVDDGNVHYCLKVWGL